MYVRLRGFNSYVWNTGATSACINTKLAGNYYVTVSDNNNCTAASNHLAINTHPLPSVSISVNGDTLTAYNSSSYQWFYDGNNIPGAISGTYIAQQSGAYTVQVTDTNGCTALSNAVNVVITGVYDIFKNQVISVYPNPASTNLTLQVPTEFIGQSIDIIDITGQLVFSNFIAQPKSTIDVSKLARGIYFLRCGNSLRKIVLE